MKVVCQGNDSLAYIDGIDSNVHFTESSSQEKPKRDTKILVQKKINDAEGEEETENPTVNELKKVFQKAIKESEIAQLNSTMSEEKAKKWANLDKQRTKQFMGVLYIDFVSYYT